MKKILSLFSVLILSLSCLVFVFAQKADNPERPGKFFAGRWAEQLGLTEEQKTQIREIMQSSKDRVRPILQEMREVRRQMSELGKDGVFNDALVNQLASREAELVKQLVIERQRTKAAIYAVLTPEQRQKAEQLKLKFKSDFKDRFGKREFKSEFKQRSKPVSPEEKQQQDEQ